MRRENFPTNTFVDYDIEIIASYVDARYFISDPGRCKYDINFFSVQFFEHAGLQLSSC